MALASLSLDDFSWDDLVAATRRHIPAASGGKWTLHAPVDPGVTLVELYAWLLEQRLFWLDQVPDTLVRAILALLGDGVAPAIAATTVLAFNAPAKWLSVASGSLLRFDRRGLSLLFTNDANTALAPVDHMGLVVAGQDRSNDLAAGRAIRLLPADGSAAEAQLVVWLPAVPASVADPLSLLLELTAPLSIAPGWAPQAEANVPPPATVSFWYRNTANNIVPWPAPVEDGTGGLRRSGVVRLPVPSDWAFEPGSTISGVSAFAVRLRTDRATFSAPPRLARLTANVVAAAHRRPADHSAIVNWLPLPGNSFVLPADDTPPIAETVQVTINETSGWQSWTPVADLAFSGPADRVFVVDRDAGTLRFGDGLTGRIPRPVQNGKFNLTVSYEVGGGVAGNLGAGLGWIDETTSTSPTAYNAVPADGGTDPELVAAARQRATDELRRVTRAITQSDYETLAVTTPGVALARAHAAMGYHSLHPCALVPGMVTVFVVPDVPREEPSDFAEDAFVAAPVPDPGALAAARARLDAARLVTHEVCVRGPIYRRAALRVQLEANPADPDALRRRVSAALRRFLDPLLGGENGTGWPFGDPLRPSELLRQAQLSLGPDGEAVEVAIGLDGAAPADSCHDVAIGDHALVGDVDVVVRLTVKPQARGGLR